MSNWNFILITFCIRLMFLLSFDLFSLICCHSDFISFNCKATVNRKMKRFDRRFSISETFVCFRSILSFTALTYQTLPQC